jgi:GDP-L-fucose synthase
VGSALVRCLERGGYTNLVRRTHAELDLADLPSVRRFFDEERPEYVMLAAAKVGGILANETYPAEFIQSNLAVQTNVIHECWRHGVRRLLFLGSSCVYPRECPQPIREESLLTSALEPTNRAYALAKIAGIEMCAAYNRQYGTRYLAAMPTNLYGPGDNYDLATSHVLPALIRRCHEAKLAGTGEIVLWGSGSPRREFLHSDDMAEACVFLLSLPEEAFARIAVGSPGFPLINIGAGADQTIAELARLVADVVGYGGRFSWDRAKPDGTPRKLLSSDRLYALGWRPKLDLRQGIGRTYREYVAALQARA